MGHYCRSCGRTRANEKFTGKGHKKHICTECSGKFGKKGAEFSINEKVLLLENLGLWNNEWIPSEETYSEYSCFFEDFKPYDVDLEKMCNDKEDEDLPF